MYRARMADAEVEPYLDVARRHRMLLLLDVQPGRAETLTEVSGSSGGCPSPTSGWRSTRSGRSVRGMYPAGCSAAPPVPSSTARGVPVRLVDAHDLPEKVFVFHQLSRRIVANEQALKAPRRRHVKSVDGIGNMAEKISPGAS